MVGRPIEGPASRTGKLVFSKTLTTVIVAKDTSIVHVKAEVAIGTLDETVSTVEIVINDASHISTVRTVCGIFFTRVARLMALLTSVAQ